jgi:hypothetical protein
LSANGDSASAALTPRSSVNGAGHGDGTDRQRQQRGGASEDQQRQQRQQRQGDQLGAREVAGRLLAGLPRSDRVTAEQHGRVRAEIAGQPVGHGVLDHARPQHDRKQGLLPAGRDQRRATRGGGTITLATAGSAPITRAARATWGLDGGAFTSATISG